MISTEHEFFPGDLITNDARQRTLFRAIDVMPDNEVQVRGGFVSVGLWFIVSLIPANGPGRMQFAAYVLGTDTLGWFTMGAEMLMEHVEPRLLERCTPPSCNVG